MTPSLQSQDCVGFIISPPSATSARAFSSRMQNHRSKKHQKTKRQHDRYDRTQVSVSPLGFATLLFLFCWFPGFVFWDWVGRKRRDAVQQAEFLYTGIISFKTAVLPSKSSIISKKCGRFHLQNARFISECSILFEGHQLLLQKVQYFLKRRRILSIYAVFFETSSNLKNVL